MIYCSERCREEANKQYHKPLCGLNIDCFIDMAMRGKSSTSRFPLMCLKILGKALQSSQYPNNSEERTNLLDKFPSHYNNLHLLYRHSAKGDYTMPSNGARLYDDFYIILSDTRFQKEPYLRVEWLIDCYEILLLNGINLSDNSNNSAENLLEQNQALLLVGSFFNHSDRPNCHWYGEFDETSRNNKAVFKAMKEIKEGEEIFISYTSDRNILEEIYKI
jgi:hypothetical protein